MNISSFAKKLGLAIASLLLVFGSLFMTASPAAADTVTVKMGSDGGQLVFDPKVVTIKVGDTIKWVNNKAFPHNIVFDGHEELSHKKLAQKPKAELESTFNEAGEFSYYCSPHRGAGMAGKVVVQ
ncbi:MULTISPECIES: plastocyanin [Pseudanabaena]|uniref:plastocyanin n=1 Tax=Pseudanabaena TaxID=1152 RepID=UPI00247880D9|nr:MULTISPECIES: plastocyanin [Pseudanabaena]MEA5487904.1 plastocyanin [Pseudanabaena sp. CCNP1317]WGS72208.1 plastocyanin [Pseudanabaena galeata CCNP1313]